jgi:hypothetical protein
MTVVVDRAPPANAVVTVTVLRSWPASSPARKEEQLFPPGRIFELYQINIKAGKTASVLSA